MEPLRRRVRTAGRRYTGGREWANLSRSGFRPEKDPIPTGQREGAMRLAPKRCCGAEARERQRGGQSQEVAHNAPLSPRVALRYRYPEEGRMALIIKDIAIV